MDNKKRGFANKPKAQTFSKAKNSTTNQTQSNSSQQPKKIRTNVENDEDFEESQEMDEDMDFLSQEEMVDEEMDINDEFCMFSFRTIDLLSKY